jgi:hypothetical protein
MMSWKSCATALLAAALLVGSSGGIMALEPPQGVPPARPGHFAEREELDAARRAGTRAAYDLFLARHPRSRFASDARREREHLTR